MSDVECDCIARARHLATMLTAAIRAGRATVPGALYVDPEAGYLAPWCDAVQGTHMRVIFREAENAWIAEPDPGQA
jgi:hypothetical protein